MSPTCCAASQQSRIVKLFIPAVQTSPSHWVVPMRVPDEDKVSERISVPASFCPFCGTKLALGHVPFEEQKPSPLAGEERGGGS